MTVKAYRLVPVPEMVYSPTDWAGRIQSAAYWTCSISGDIIDSMGGPFSDTISIGFYDWLRANREKLTEMYRSDVK